MASHILLARPHPFIVSDMKPFLEEAGFQIIKAEKLSDLTGLARNSSGAVISLAVSSPMDASPEEVIKSLRQTQPMLPLLFASLLPYAEMKEGLKRIGSRAGLITSVFGLDDEGSVAEESGPTGLLYLSKNDLAGSASRQRALQLVRHHFNVTHR